MIKYYIQYNYSNNAKLDIITKGICSARYQSILYVQNCFLVVACTNLHLINPSNSKIEVCIRENKSVIYSLLENKNFIFSIGNGGDIVIISKNNLKVCHKLQAAGREVRHCSCNDMWLNICCETFDDDKIGINQIFNLQNIDENNPPLLHFNLIDPNKNPLRYGELIQSKLLILAESRIQSSENQENKQQGKHTYYLRQFDIEQKIFEKELHLPYVSQIISVSSNGSQYICYNYMDRRIMLFDFINFKQIKFLQIEGGGSISYCYLYEQTLLLFPEPNYILLIQVADNMQLPDFIPKKQIIQEEFYSQQNLKSQISDPKNFFIKWIGGVLNQLVVFNENGLIHYDFQVKQTKFQILIGGLTYVGLDSNQDESLFAVGDLLGNIFIFSTQNNEVIEPISIIFVFNGVRSLTWAPDGIFIIAGLLNGDIMKINSQTSEVRQIQSIKGSVTSLRFKHINKRLLLLCTSTTGDLYIFEEQNDIFNQIIKFTSHYAIEPEDKDRFGSLHLAADIWSSCWSANDNVIATCSEDQTVNILKLDLNVGTKIELFQNLKGHQLAVTSVDWQFMGENIGEVFVCCSDDQSFRIYDPMKQFELKCIAYTSFIKEWHTLTYLALQKEGKYLAIGSQNGYLFIYDIAQKQFIFAEKIHMGGIEGMVWRKNKLITCSSDLCINIITNINIA